MDGENKSTGSEKPPELTLEWIGMQFYRRHHLTNAIVQRSFPFWGPSVEFARMHANQSNKLPVEERTYWTHIAVHSSLVETKEGARHNQIGQEESV